MSPSALPPRAPVRPTHLEAHGHVRVDDYYWLRDATDPAVREYLEAENAYTRAAAAHTGTLEQRLFEEIKGRIKQTDMSVPFREGSHLYHTRYEDGREYPIFCRAPLADPTADQVLLDVNLLASGHDFCTVGAREVSPDEQWLAYAMDTVGRRVYTIRFRHLTDGRLLDDVIPAVTNNCVWANDNRTLFYTRQDPLTLRAYRIYRHRLGTPVDDDVLVFEEADETFSVAVSRSRSKRFLIVASYQTLSTEYRYLEASAPDGGFRIFLPRARDHEYHIDHFRDTFYIRTNDRARNFRLMAVDDRRPDRDRWREVIPHRDDVFLRGFELFRSHLVVEERTEGLMRLRIRPWDGPDEHVVDFGEAAYAAYIDVNREAETEVLRYGYSSLTTPTSTYDYHMVTRHTSLLKREPVLGDFDPGRYQTERCYALASDGVRVPLSIVYRKELRRADGNPLLLYGYGAYGISLDASFSSPRLSLLDRGFVYAIAHVRGGQENGRQWYDDGKLLKKRNTFTDFIACAEHLIASGLTARDRLFAMGVSAGGLLIGAVLNTRPDLFCGAVASVPFVDVVTTMLDETLPLTTSEYDEWGNPHDKRHYDYMLSYSPYDNVEAKAYPHLLVLAGLHDSQVQYWEPAKWVAKLRACKTDGHRLLLKMNLEAGHQGPSGRYREYRETAFQYAFLLDLAGLLKPGAADAEM